MAKTIDSFNFNSLELENSWDVSPFSDNERARIIHIGFFFPTIKVDGDFKLIQGRQGKYNLEMYSNLEFFNKLKKYAKNVLGLKNVTIGEPRIVISGESDPADWDEGVNAKVGFDEDRDGFKTSIWQSFNEDESIEKKEIGLNWIVDRRFRGTCTIAIVDVLITELYAKVNLKVGEILVKEMVDTRPQQKLRTFKNF